jgi:hypothetical protein
MKKLSFLIALFLLSAIVTIPALAANKPYDFKCRTKIIRDGIVRYENRNYNYNFLLEVVSDNNGTKYEAWKNGHPFITANPGERYSLIIHNPLPVRVAVNLTIDGLNSITGKPCRPDADSKWIIEPYSYITIRGWQINGNDARRFYFTTKDESYADWRSNSWGKDLSVNCGVIGAAYFWSKKDLERYFEENPVYEYTPRPVRYNSNCWELEKSRAGSAAPCLEDKALGKKDQQAGTGMGERESNPIEMVRFDYDTGMYKAKDALIIYYDFAKAEPQPQPFLGMDFAPEQPLF